MISSVQQMTWTKNLRKNGGHNAGIVLFDENLYESQYHYLDMKM